HGTLAVPDAPGAAIPGAEQTQRAMEELGRRFDAVRPDATIVVTPHNVHVDGHFAVVLAGNVAGTLADWEAPAVELSCPVDLELAVAVEIGRASCRERVESSVGAGRVKRESEDG